MGVFSGFASDYAEAVDKFRAAASAVKAEVERYEHPDRAPDGGALSTDVAWIGPAEAKRVLVLLSGVHGVEGFCGSGIQVEWMHRIATTPLAEGVAALLVHAVNPYGFAWTRRATEDNVDANRNWLDFDSPLPENPEYQALAATLVPAEWTPESCNATNRILQQYIGQHGMTMFQSVVTRGQCCDPNGLFYSGRQPTWTRRTLSAIMTKHLAPDRTVAVLDFHTGLGPWGMGEEIVTEPRTASAFSRATRWYGNCVRSTIYGDAVATDLVGDTLTGVCRLFPSAEMTAIALEFGVRPALETLQALRADAWLHAYGDPLSEQGVQIRAQMKAAFFDDSDAWKGMILGQALTTIRRAQEGIVA